MGKEKTERLNQKRVDALFNGVTEKGRLENQNQSHNSRREGMGPNTKRKSD